MFSSLLPKPQHCSVASVKIILPQKSVKVSDALLVPAPKEQPLINLQQTIVEYGKPLDPDSLNTPQGSHEDTVPLKVRFPNLKHHFPRYTIDTAPDGSLAACVEESRQIVDKLLGKGDATAPLPSSVVISTNGETKSADIATYKEDPMLPPKFKLRKNREKPPSPPPPVLKAAPAEKVTKEVKDKWHIPAAVSNWKNNQGFTLDLNKRVMAASGGSAPTGLEINYENFTLLASALERADKSAREEIAVRNEQRKEMALKEQQEKERQLKELVEKTRAQRALNLSKRHAGPLPPQSYKRLRH